MFPALNFGKIPWFINFPVLFLNVCWFHHKKVSEIATSELFTPNPRKVGSCKVINFMMKIVPTFIGIL